MHEIVSVDAEDAEKVVYDFVAPADYLQAEWGKGYTDG
jgi:hypothetical protein